MPLGYIRYNDVEMEIKSHLNPIVSENIYSDDGTTFLYRRWEFNILAVVNPGADIPGMAVPMSYLSGSPPIRVAGMHPVDTLHAIEQRLRTPRKPLVYSVGDNILLKSPPDATVSCDSNNGPQPLHVNITETHGIKTILVHFRVVTWVNTCKIVREGGGSPGQPLSQQGRQASFRLAVGAAGTAAGNPLLSHRWTRTETIDQDHFVTVAQEGTAVFDTAVLQKIGLGARLPDDVLRAWPDQYRQDLLPLIPHPAWKRDNIQIVPDSDGSTLYYRVVDRELPYSFGSNKNLTRAECYTTGWFGRMGAAGAAASEIGKALDFRIGPAAINFGVNQMPKYRWNVLARVWGNALSKKSTCIRTAVGLALNRMIGLVAAPDVTEWDSVEFFVSVEDTGKWAECSMTVNTGLEQLFAQIGRLFVGEHPGGHAAGIRHVADSMSARSEGINFAYNDATGYTHDTVTPGGVTFDMGAPGTSAARSPNDFNPPNSNKTRGTALVNLFHQILSSDACSPPPCSVSLVADSSDTVTYERVLCSPARPGSSSPLGSRRAGD